jgi:hypothetical protein
MQEKPTALQGPQRQNSKQKRFEFRMDGHACVPDILNQNTRGVHCTQWLNLEYDLCSSIRFRRGVGRRNAEQS